MIHPEEMEVVKMVFGFALAVVAVAAIVGTTWIKQRGKVQQGVSPALMNRLDDIAERLSRLDGSIDTIAVEVERISEAQRFTARVLAERASPATLPDPNRSLTSKTPH